MIVPSRRAAKLVRIAGRNHERTAHSGWHVALGRTEPALGYDGAVRIQGQFVKSSGGNTFAWLLDTSIPRVLTSLGRRHGE